MIELLTGACIVGIAVMAYHMNKLEKMLREAEADKQAAMDWYHAELKDKWYWREKYRETQR